MSVSNDRAIMDLVNALPPAAENEAPTSASLAQVKLSSTRRCACMKAKAKCLIACHEGINQDNTSDCPNISAMSVRTQRGHRTRDVVNEAKR